MQLWCYYRRGGLNSVHSIETQDRLQLGQILKEILKAFGIGKRRAKTLVGLLISHFGVAEWAALRDRDKIAKKHLTSVRNVPVSFKLFKVTVNFGSNNYAKPQLFMRDTMLLAPGKKQGLKDIASVTKHKKLELTPDQISNMDKLLTSDPTLYEAYAINDTRVTLEYYLRFMEDYENLLYVEELPLTLGDAAVRAYKNWLKMDDDLSHEIVFGYEQANVKNSQGHNTTQLKKTFSRAISETFAAYAYHGGENIAFIHDAYHNPDKVILDIDFAGAYPAALATLPVIDWKKRRIPIYKQRRLSVYQTANIAPGGFVPISFVRCDFKFPADCWYPCIPMPTKDGLKYPLEGTTTCTGVEVALAIDMGAQVEITDGESFLSLQDERGIPRLAFADFLATITQKRAQEVKGTLRNLMLKEVANSFYGKLAQGIEERNIYNFTGGKDKLKPSEITTPHYAAMCTGIVRAALSAVVHEVGKCDDCEVLSATTDGCMVAVPKRFELETDTEGKVKEFSFAEWYPELYESFKTYYPVRALEQGRLNMGHDADTWLEAKHAGDWALTLKTRGNILKYKGVTQHLAKAGHQADTAEDLIALHEQAGIPVVEVAFLASAKDIYEGNEQDLVRVTTNRAANTDFDYKRIPLLDDSGRTRPPRTVEESAQYRRAADNLRKRGTRATPENVFLNLHGHSLRGGNDAAVKRYVHKAMAQKQGGWNPQMKDERIAELLGITLSAFKGYRRGKKFLPQSIPDTPEVRAIVQKEFRKVGYRVIPPGMERALFAMM